MRSGIVGLTFLSCLSTNSSQMKIDQKRLISLGIRRVSYLFLFGVTNPLYSALDDQPLVSLHRMIQTALADINKNVTLAAELKHQATAPGENLGEHEQTEGDRSPHTMTAPVMVVTLHYITDFDDEAIILTLPRISDSSLESEVERLKAKNTQLIAEVTSLRDIVEELSRWKSKIDLGELAKIPKLQSQLDTLATEKKTKVPLGMSIVRVSVCNGSILP